MKYLVLVEIELTKMPYSEQEIDEGFTNLIIDSDVLPFEHVEIKSYQKID